MYMCMCACVCACVCVRVCVYHVRVCVCRLAWMLSLIIRRNKVCEIEMLVWEEGNRNAFLISRVLPMDWKIAPGSS